MDSVFEITCLAFPGGIDGDCRTYLSVVLPFLVRTLTVGTYFLLSLPHRPPLAGFLFIPVKAHPFFVRMRFTFSRRNSLVARFRVFAIPSPASAA